MAKKKARTDLPRGRKVSYKGEVATVVGVSHHERQVTVKLPVETPAELKAKVHAGELYRWWPYDEVELVAEEAAK